MTDRTLPSTLWVGGTPGAGKTTTAAHLARELDLVLAPVDVAAGADDFRGEAERQVARVVDALVLREAAAGPEGGATALVEGPQLDPGSGLAPPPGHAVWLLATPDRVREVRRERAPDGATGVPTLAGLDDALTERLRRAATAAGHAVVDVGSDPDRAAVVARVREALAPGLARARRLAPGAALRGARRWENDRAYRRLVELEGAAGPVTSRRFGFACECGRSGCTATWAGRPYEYAMASAAGPVTAPGHG